MCSGFCVFGLNHGLGFGLIQERIMIWNLEVCSESFRAVCQKTKKLEHLKFSKISDTSSAPQFPDFLFFDYFNQIFPRIYSFTFTNFSSVEKLPFHSRKVL